MHAFTYPALFPKKELTTYLFVHMSRFTSALKICLTICAFTPLHARPLVQQDTRKSCMVQLVVQQKKKALWEKPQNTSKSMPLGAGSSPVRMTTVPAVNSARVVAKLT